MLGAAELLLGVGCMALTFRKGRPRISRAVFTAAAVTAGMFHIRAGWERTEDKEGTIV